MRLLGQLAEEDGGFHASDGEGVVDDALAVLFGGAGAHHVLVRNPEPGQAAFALRLVSAVPSSRSLDIAVEK